MEEVVEAIKRTFRKFDEDCRGTIHRDELAAVLKDLNDSFSDDILEYLLDDADKSKDSVINYDEFVESVVFHGEEAPKKKAVQKQWQGPNTEGSLRANMNLHAGASIIHAQTVEEALFSGAGVNSDSDGRGTALISAANAYDNKLEAKAIIGTLLRAQADPDAITENGYSALHRAASNGNWELAMMLCRQGHADVNIVGNALQTPLHTAASYGRLDCIRILLNYNADMDARDFQGYTPLHVAVQDDQPEAANALLQHGAPVMVKDDGVRYDTPLHIAVRLTRLSCINVLLNFQNGAYASDMIGCKNYTGRTPLDLASNCNNDEIKGILMDWNSNSKCST